MKKRIQFQCYCAAASMDLTWSLHLPSFNSTSLALMCLGGRGLGRAQLVSYTCRRRSRKNKVANHCVSRWEGDRVKSRWSRSRSRSRSSLSSNGDDFSTCFVWVQSVLSWDHRCDVATCRPLIGSSVWGKVGLGLQFRQQVSFFHKEQKMSQKD